MPTIVFFHAHPDDESTQTSGSMARASAEGSRVVVVYATNGDHGEAPDDLAPDETVADRRRLEAQVSADATGTARVAWLGYADSGMAGWDQNGAQGSFHTADIGEAAGRLADILDEEDADVLVGYDWHGNYGHPDHVKVHEVAHRAADLAARRPRLLESTMNRDKMRRELQAAREAGEESAFDTDGDEFDPDKPMDDGNPIGTPESEISWEVDVSGFLPVRLAAVQAHASQKTDTGWITAMPEEVFALSFGTEYYIEPGRQGAMQRGWPLASLS
ncbi:MAG: PIG-L family deacetylase [Actinomycetota bacterium]|nr:PIG-L family deacetylase [Actinomycetota bacterium]